MKVLHLPFGAQLIVLCKALREVGVDATSCHFRPSKFQMKPDLNLFVEQGSPEEQIMKREEFFKRAVKEYDVFHFHHGETFFPDLRDLPILKKLGKKLVMQHRGSDVRVLSIAQSFGNPFVRIKGGEHRKPEYITSRLQEISKYIKHAIVVDHELLSYVENHYKKVHIVRQAIDLQQFSPVYPSNVNQPPLIVHAPSHAKVKGTKFIIKAIRQLQEKGFKLRFKLIQDLSHQEALQAYKEADIIIDQLLVGSFGVLSLEGMALGKPVICYIREDLKKKYPQGLPIINANPDNICEKLKKVIRKPDRWDQYGWQGRQYVESYYDSLLTAKDLVSLYQRL